MTTSALEQCQKARKLWLEATTQEDLDQVEEWYRLALNAKQPPQPQEQQQPPKKKQKNTKKKYAALTTNEYRSAAERLSLLYCQSGRTQRAKKGLEYLGFVCRLSKHVLDYPFCKSTTTTIRTKQQSRRKQKDKTSAAAAPPPCVIYNDFLTTRELQHMQSIFQDPQASYWKHHDYQVEPPSPYFSYVIPIHDTNTQQNNNNKYGFVGKLVQKMITFPPLRQKFPNLKNAKFVELWAHNRPHASGHQLHFDSDDEGRGGLRHPIVSTILYITASGGGGGPSLVTNQRLEDDSTGDGDKPSQPQCLATQGWLAHPKVQRLVAFDGRVLHGVVPGKGAHEGRRVTLMLAFWKDICVRDEETPGSARPFPTKKKTTLPPPWARGLTDPSIPVVVAGGAASSSSLEEVPPMELKTVYETLDGEPWKPKYGMPDYEQVFQGF
jgi:methyl-CpG-binding domain protein 4